MEKEQFDLFEDLPEEKLGKTIWCSICEAEIDRQEYGSHVRAEQHTQARDALIEAALLALRLDPRLCAGCPALTTDDEAARCRLHYSRYYDGWYNNLFGYINDETGNLELEYPNEGCESDLKWSIVAIRPARCIEQIGDA